VFFLAVSFVIRGRGLATLLLFLDVMKEAGRIYVWDMPWPPAAECNMITNKQTRDRVPPSDWILLKKKFFVSVTEGSCACVVVGECEALCGLKEVVKSERIQFKGSDHRI